MPLFWSISLSMRASKGDSIARFFQHGSSTTYSRCFGNPLILAEDCHYSRDFESKKSVLAILAQYRQHKALNSVRFYKTFYD